MHTVTLDGITYRSAKAACNAIGLPYKTFITRRREGKSVSDSLSLDRKRGCTHHSTHAHPVIIQGKEYKSVSEACRAHNISYITVRSRIRHKNMSLEEAIVLPKQDITRPKK